MTTTEKVDVTTRVEDMPPLHVTTVGIPEQEHIERERRQTRSRQHHRDVVTWTIVGLVLVLFGLFAATVYTPKTDTHMGLSPYAWSQYRAGERAPAPLTLPAPTTPTYPFTAITP